MAGGADHLLLDALGRRLRHPAGWLAVALHLSRLAPPAPRPHHRRIARVLMEDTARRHEGAVFALSNGDLVLLCRDGNELAPVPTLRVATPASLPGVLGRLLRADVADPGGVISVWPLGNAGGKALEYAVARVSASGMSALGGGAPARHEGRLADAAAPLADGTDVSPQVRRRTAILIAGSGVRPLFRHIGFWPALAETAAALPAAPPVSPLGARGTGADPDPYLVRHMAEQRDGRLLALLDQATGDRGPLDPTVAGAPRLHLSLALASLRGDAFGRLAETLRLRGLPLGVEIALTEVCADPVQFERARSDLRRLGMTVTLEALSRHTLGRAYVAALQADLVKLAWVPEMAGDGPFSPQEDALIRDVGADRVVLEGADTEAALRWGLERGIRRFQGRHADAMLGALRFSTCPAATRCTLADCIGREGAGTPSGRHGCRNLPLLDAAAPPPSPAAKLPAAAMDLALLARAAEAAGHPAAVANA